MESFLRKSAMELAGLIRSRQLSPVELMQATLRRIESVNPHINAFVALRAEEALKQARNLEDDIAARMQELHTLLETSAAVASTLDSHTVLARILAQVERLQKRIVRKTNAHILIQKDDRLANRGYNPRRPFAGQVFCHS